MLQRLLKVAGVILVVIVGIAFISVVFFKKQTSQRYADNDLGIVYGEATGLGMPSSIKMASRKSSLQMAPAMDSAVMPMRGVVSNSSVERMVIKTADLSLVVEDVYNAAKDIADFANKNEGFVVNSYIYKMGLSPLGTVSIRIPGAKFESSMESLKKMGEVKSERASGDDITEEFVDLEAQLKNYKAVEVQYLQILAKAQKISDILEVQRELANVRSNIERLQGRMKFLRQSTDLASITIQLAADPESLPTYDDQNKWKPVVVVKEALRALTDAAKSLVDLIIWFVVFVPVWLFMAVVIWVGYRLVRKFWSSRV